MDYGQAGFKCGLEIHQQLDVGKLFCSCKAALRKDKPDFIVKRRLRATAGESGKIDAAAAHAQTKGLSYIYEGYDSTTCLVELDEEPPHEINKEALNTALTIATILHCDIPDYIQVMRKTVVDGSNTSGFQRTLLVGLNGWIKTPEGKVGISSVCLEEDSARRTSEDKKTVTFRLDRLGIPLIEIATDPEVKTPEHAQEVSLALGRILRSTEKVMRGIGTIRQDVNVSTKSHPRIELKGFQDLRSMPETIRLEIKRQQQEISKRSKIEPHVRNVKPDFTSKYLRPMSGAARMYPGTDLPLIYITEKQLKDIRRTLPELPDKKLARIIKSGLNEDLANQVLFSKKFSKLHTKFPKVDPKLIATTLLSTQKEVKKKLKQENGDFELEHFEKIFRLLDQGKISKEAIPDILTAVAKGEKIESAVKQFELLSESELKKEINKLKKEFSKVPEHKLKGVLIGKLRGRARVADIIRFLSQS
jgi:Glu-tRNA(Gln) amidotransferase subunit E-like FAD-binding protein